MNSFKDAIKIEQKRIQRLLDLNEPSQLLHDDVEANAAGNLRATRRGSTTYYYEEWREKNKPRRKVYLGTADSPRAKLLADARFHRERLRRLHTDANLLQKLACLYQDYDVNSIRDALPRTYRELVTEDSFNQRYEEIRQWAAANYEVNTAPFPMPEIYAKDGRRMRSKGECLMYNIFDELQLPNRYDSVITIVDGDGRMKKVSPDFLIQCFDGSLIIIEHLGWFTGLKYGIDFGEKCYWYLQKGFILGKNFFVTSDDVNGGTDSRIIMDVVQQVERKFYGY